MSTNQTIANNPPSESNEMASLYLILTSLIFPVLAISWLCCIACCIYRGLLRNLNKPGRTTKVQVISKALKLYNVMIHQFFFFFASHVLYENNYSL